MAESLNIATWNIGGAHTTNSAKTFDYDQENLNYFAQMLRPLDCDVVCLQESHTGNGRIIAEELAGALELPYVFDSPRSLSHIDGDYQLANAIISRYPIEVSQHVRLPDPPFELFFEDGTKARLFPTYVQIAEVRGVTVANTHLQPLHLFGHDWGKGAGKNLAAETENVFLKHLQTPLMFAGDFNAPHLAEDFSRFMGAFQLQPALDSQPTDAKGNKMDYILYSPDFILRKSGVIISEKSDHHLGWAELEVAPSASF